MFTSFEGYQIGVVHIKKADFSMSKYNKWTPMDDKRYALTRIAATQYSADGKVKVAVNTIGTKVIEVLYDAVAVSVAEVSYCEKYKAFDGTALFLTPKYTALYAQDQNNRNEVAILTWKTIFGSQKTRKYHGIHGKITVASGAPDQAT